MLSQLVFEKKVFIFRRILSRSVKVCHNDFSNGTFYGFLVYIEQNVSYKIFYKNAYIYRIFLSQLVFEKMEFQVNKVGCLSCVRAIFCNNWCNNGTLYDFLLYKTKCSLLSFLLKCKYRRFGYRHWFYTI